MVGLGVTARGISLVLELLGALDVRVERLRGLVQREARGAQLAGAGSRGAARGALGPQRTQQLLAPRQQTLLLRTRRLRSLVLETSLVFLKKKK